MGKLLKTKKFYVIAGITVAVVFVVSVIVAVILGMSGKQTSKEKSPNEISVDKTISELKIPNYNDVRGNITLPLSDSEYGTTISWKADKEGIVDVVANGKAPAGVVHRQKEDVKVTLTATVTKGDVTKEKEIKLTVKAAYEMPETTDYLFYSFKGDNGSSDQQIFLSASRDGNIWKDLNDGYNILNVSTSKTGDKGVRDPFIIRSPEGDRFYLIATDLCIGTGAGTHDWGSAQGIATSSKSIRIWESTDLVNWSEPWLAKIGVTTSSFTWAPEVIWDNESQMYMIYWAAGNTKDSDNPSSPSQNRTWYVLTRDFITFTEPDVYSTSVNNEGQIDMSIIHAGDNTYYRISSSSPDIVIEKSETGLFGEWSKVSTLQELGLGYGAAGNTTSGITIVEGPEFFKYNKDDCPKDENGLLTQLWGILVDNYGGVGYFPIVTTDLGSTDGSDFYTPEYDFDANLKRHGTILPVTAEEYNNVIEKWGSSVNISDEPEAKEPVLKYDFENVDGTTVKDSGTGNETSDDGVLNGKATVVNDPEKGNVLQLDGTSGTFLEFPKGFFDARNAMTVSMDVKNELSSGNYFTFTYGLNDQKYAFMRIRGTSVRHAITTSSYGSEREIAGNGAAVGVWQNITLVISGKNADLYLDGEYVTTSQMGLTTAALGKDLSAYLGKSFYGGDRYFKGCFDNVVVYNRALTRTEVIELTGATDQAVYSVDSEEKCVSGFTLDTEKKVINISLLKNVVADSDLTNVAVTFKLSDNASMESTTINLDLTSSNEVEIEYNGQKEVWIVKGDIGTNPVIDGQFADPDIDYFNGVYYIYPTTDGYAGWGGYQFHCFSSTDLVTWKDEGIILDVRNDNVNGADNENGYQGVPWADGNAWAPTIEEKNGKYYFYFCAKRAGGDSCIGVAVADSPTGPFVAQDEPLMTPESVLSEGKISGGQVIDPSIFTDDDGKSYILWGNGYGAVAQLGDDMMSIVPGTYKKYSNTVDLRESIVVIKRNGIYHFTWSCDDTGSENYRVNYGYSSSLYGDITYVGTILAKDTGRGILGTGHQSLYYDESSDKCYIAYHRFVTPLGKFTSDFGIHRETCIDEVTFNEETGLMEIVIPTH